MSDLKKDSNSFSNKRPSVPSKSASKNREANASGKTSEAHSPTLLDGPVPILLSDSSAPTLLHTSNPSDLFSQKDSSPLEEGEELDIWTQHTLKNEVSSTDSERPTVVSISPAHEVKGTIHSYQKRRYRYHGKLGAGGMGEVFRVLDLNLKRDIAVKVLSNSVDENEEHIGRFLSEAQITAQLEHPNIVPIHELSVDRKGKVFFTMKKVEGVPLSKIIKGLEEKNPKTISEWPQNELLRCFRKICDAVAFAHAHQVIHRDLKPDNIMIGKFGEVLVMDWGLAKILNQDDLPSSSKPAQVQTVRQEQGNLTLDGSISGTPLYMSPEQASGKTQEIREASDIYSLGAILFELFSYQAPVEGKNIREILTNVIQGTRLELLDINPNAPKEIAAITSKCLQFKPKDRYRCIEDLAKDIDAFLDDETVSCYKGNLVYRMKKFIRRHPTGVALVGTVIFFSLILFVLSSYFLYQNSQLMKEREEANLVAFKNKELALQKEQELAFQERKSLEETQRRASAYKPFQEAVELLRRQDDHQAVLKKLEEAINEYPHFYAALFELGVWHQKNQNGEKAIEYFQKAQEVYYAEKKETDLKSLFNMGFVALYILKKQDEALVFFKQILQEAPNQKNPYTLMAQAYLKIFEGDFESAYQSAMDAHQLDEHLWEVHVTVAEITSIGTDLRQDFCHFNQVIPETAKLQGQEKEGHWPMTPIMCWSDAIRLVPDFGQAYLNRGLVYDAVSQVYFKDRKIFESKSYREKAYKDYLEAKKLNLPQGYLQLARFTIEENNVSEAESLLNEFRQKFSAETFSLFSTLEKQLAQKKREQGSPRLLEIIFQSEKEQRAVLATNLPNETVVAYFWIIDGVKIGGNRYSLVKNNSIEALLPEEKPKNTKEVFLWFTLSLHPEDQTERVSLELQDPKFNYSWKNFEQHGRHYYYKVPISFKK